MRVLRVRRTGDGLEESVPSSDDVEGLDCRRDAVEWSKSDKRNARATEGIPVIYQITPKPLGESRPDVRLEGEFWASSRR